MKESLIWAPSAGNLQSRRFLFVYNESIKQKLVKAAMGQHFIAEAPLVVLGCADLHIGGYYGERGINLYCLQDVAASIENLALTACAEGLGSVWVGAFDEKEATRALNIPQNLRPVVIMPVGYPDENPMAPARIRTEDAITEIE